LSPHEPHACIDAGGNISSDIFKITSNKQY